MRGVASGEVTTMCDEVRWTVVMTYGAVFEAELASGILADAGIPAQVRGEYSGVFGAGWSGTVVKGVDVLVPEERAEEARDLLAQE